MPVQPQISAPIQLIGARRRSEQSVSCVAEASPRPINYWTFGTGEMIVANEKFIVKVSSKLQLIYRLVSKQLDHASLSFASQHS